MNNSKIPPRNIENWLSINGYKNYQVSWFGRIRNPKTGRMLKGSPSDSGYLYVCSCRKGERNMHSIHMLVAHEWVENAKEKRCVDHIDSYRHNNHVENLRFATHTEKT